MAHAKQLLGRRGESLVARYLERNGFLIVERNLRVGRYELDLVARRDSLLVVCEVRSRSSSRYGAPVETIDQQKIGRIRRATARWLQSTGTCASQIRFDAASVVFSNDHPPTVHYYPDAFH